MNEARELYDQGVRAVRDLHDMEQGGKLLAMSLRLDPENDDAWVWLARVVTDPDRKRKCITRALAINPDNLRAQKLQRLFATAPVGAARSSTAAARATASVRAAAPVTRSTGSFAAALAARAPAQKSRTTTTTAAAATSTSTVTSLFRAVGISMPTEAETNALSGVSPDSLGKTVLTIRTRKLYYLGWIVVVLALLGGAAFMLYAGPLNPENTPSPMDALFVGIALALVLAALWIGVDIYDNSGRAVILTEGGLIISTHGKQKGWRWDQFTSVKVEEEKVSYGSIIGRSIFGYGLLWMLWGRNRFGGRMNDTMFSMDLRIAKKRVLKLSRSYTDARDARKVILEATGRAMVPDYIRRYEHGETLEFGGKVRLDRAEGLQGRWGVGSLGGWGKPIQLKGIIGMHFEEREEQTDMLVVMTIDDTKKFNLNKIPNAHVLERMLERITGWQILPSS